MQLGSELTLDGDNYLVVEIANSTLTLRNLETRDRRHMHITELFMRGQLESTETVPIASDADISSVATMNQKANDDAEFWREHVEEVLYGRRYSAEPSEKTRVRYDPGVRALYRRIESKVTELSRPPYRLKVSARTVRRKVRRYETLGFAGLVDKRLLRTEGPLNRADERIVEVLQDAVEDQTNRSSVTRGKVIGDAVKVLRRRYGNDLKLPHISTMYRYLDELTAGKETFGLATSRRSRARSPKHTYGQLRATRPGEYAQIDSTKMDVLALDEQGRTCRVTVSIIIDVFTCSIISFVMRPEALKGVDQALLLARAFVPAPFRPHHTEQMKMAQSGLPFEHLLSLDERFADALAMPYIVPETITTDNGSDFLTPTFTSACAKYGIAILESATYSPTDKAKVERTFGSINSLFTQHLNGYVGNSPGNRGYKVEGQRLYSIVTLQEIFEEWIVRIWQNRPHRGLRDPLAPSILLTPNQMYTASIGVSPSLTLPVSESDYIELLPSTARTIQRDGVHIGNRVYDSEQLHPFRATKSPRKSDKGKWEVRFDPYSPAVVWVRNYEKATWMECGWKNIDSFNSPFFTETWQSARELARAQGLGGSVDHIVALQQILERREPELAKAATKKGRKETADKLVARDYVPRPEAMAVPRREALNRLPYVDRTLAITGTKPDGLMDGNESL
ncbi:Mu transposase C-terminal domain-containing protein [Cryobacterium sp. 10I5]|uniref:Mu transposase C-terminal domain-containing protein n=1 Tax=Cryobacterium sp. 10I5 TaxID=3048581 RepID=UPI002B235E13|nr:Mu transposase C-terminal domain-containing protein [Cryobacterium sp. 10I5]MEB0266809.1 Mu transposase C-terminal domain-containing protein [Cryobacterium sp. 10I5]